MAGLLVEYPLPCNTDCVRNQRLLQLQFHTRLRTFAKHNKTRHKTFANRKLLENHIKIKKVKMHFHA